MIDEKSLSLLAKLTLSWLLLALSIGAMPLSPAAAQTAVPPTCQEIILDGGFEESNRWLLEVTPWKAAIVTEGAHSGQQAVFIGLRPEDENVESHSIVQQRVVLPADAATITLSLWLRAPVEGDDGDRHYVLLLSDQAEIVAVPLFSRITGDEWQERVFDITALSGQPLTLQIGVSNNGSDQRAALLVDDVSIVACQAAEAGTEPAATATATPSPIPTPQPTATPEPTITPEPSPTPTVAPSPSATPTQRSLASPTSAPTNTPPATSAAQATRLVQRSPTPTNSPTPIVVFDLEPPPQQVPLLDSQAAPILIATLLSSVVVLAVLAINTRRPPR